MNFLEQPLNHTRTQRQLRDTARYGNPFVRLTPARRHDWVYVAVTLVCFAAIGVMLAA